MQWLWGRLISPGCLVCANPCGPDEDLCRDCQDELPIVPFGCVHCGSPLSGDSPVPCGQCLKRPPAFDSVWAPFAYDTPVDQFIQQFKFAGDLTMGRTLATLMLQKAPLQTLPEALVPVPLHPKRLLERGFNQADELAIHLGRALSIEVVHGLQRTSVSRSQTSLDASGRKRNLAGAFSVTGTLEVSHVALIDDVMTTATTAHRCARALKRAGVERVDVWVCGRA